MHSIFAITVCLFIAIDDNLLERLLIDICKQKVNQNVMIHASIARKETLKDGRIRVSSYILANGTFNGNVFCSSERDIDGDKIARKACKGCYPVDKNRVLARHVGSLMNGQKSDKEFFTALNFDEALKYKYFFDLRLMGCFVDHAESVDYGYEKIFFSESEIKAQVNALLSTESIVCIEYLNPKNTNVLRYFVDKVHNRILKITAENNMNDYDSFSESFYNRPGDLYPKKITVKSRLGSYHRQETIDVHEVRFLKIEDDFDWTMKTIGLSENTFLSGSKLSKTGKGTFQTSFYYDGKVIRESTKDDFDRHGKSIQKIEEIPVENLRVEKKSSLFYVIACFFFLLAPFVIMRMFYLKWRK
jgi:hypothetical protein